MPRRPKLFSSRRIVAILALAGAAAVVTLATGQWELGILTVAAGAAIGSLARNRRHEDVTSITTDPAETVDRMWEQLENDVEHAETDASARHEVLVRYERELAEAVRRHPKGHPIRTLWLAATADVMHQLGEIEAAALLGCQLVDCVPGAPYELQLQCFSLLAGIERDGGSAFGQQGIYRWLEGRLSSESALCRATWAIECGVMEEDRGDHETAIARYRDALRVLEPVPSPVSPYRNDRTPRDPAEILATIDARTRLASVLVLEGEFDAAYEAERELEHLELQPAQLRWVQRRLAHHAHNIGAYDECRRRLLGLLDVAESDEDRARLLTALAEIERDLGHVETAHDYATQAYVLQAVDGGSPSSSTLAALSRIELELGNDTIAQALLGEAPGVQGEGDIDPRIAEVQALLSCHRGHFDFAEDMAQAALVSAVAHYGSDHLFITDALHVMGTVLTAMDRLEEATTLLGRAVEIVESATSSHHPALVKLLEAMARAEPDPGRADRHRARLQRICSAHGFIARNRARPRV